MIIRARAIPMDACSGAVLAQPFRDDNRQAIERTPHRLDDALQPIHRPYGGQHVRRIRPLPAAGFEQSFFAQLREQGIEKQLLRSRFLPPGAELNTLGDVTIVLSKIRLNGGPKKIILIVTNLETQSASQILGIYSRRWAMEVTIKELQGQPQVLLAVLLSVMKNHPPIGLGLIVAFPLFRGAIMQWSRVADTLESSSLVKQWVLVIIPLPVIVNPPAPQRVN